MDEEPPAEAVDHESNQDIEEDSVESSAGQIDSVDAEPPSEIREVVESATGSGSGDTAASEATSEEAIEPGTKNARTDDQDS